MTREIPVLVKADHLGCVILSNPRRLRVSVVQHLHVVQPDVSHRHQTELHKRKFIMSTFQLINQPLINLITVATIHYIILYSLINNFFILSNFQLINHLFIYLIRYFYINYTSSYWWLITLFSNFYNTFHLFINQFLLF